MAWPIALLNGTANRMLRLMGIPPPGEHERLHSPEEIRMLVEQSTEGGSLLREDARLLEGVFEFSEKTAQEVMTPRTQMVALESSLTVEEAADEVAVARRSRYPVYTESLDEIVGVVHAKDILTALRARPRETVRDIMRPPLFVPGTREVEDVLADMKRLKTHLAVVLDEYGGTAGLVTIEDILEEIVGEISDEYDQDAAEVEHLPNGGVRVPSRLSLDDLGEVFDVELDDDDVDSVGGLMAKYLGRVPIPGAEVQVDSLRLVAEAPTGRRNRLGTVIVSVTEEQEQPEQQPAGVDGDES
jgi:CBS domain containing-hemolysin-like protein